MDSPYCFMSPPSTHYLLPDPPSGVGLGCPPGGGGVWFSPPSYLLRLSAFLPRGWAWHRCVLVPYSDPSLPLPADHAFLPGAVRSCPAFEFLFFRFSPFCEADVRLPPPFFSTQHPFFLRGEHALTPILSGLLFFFPPPRRFFLLEILHPRCILE